VFASGLQRPRSRREALATSSWSARRAAAYVDPTIDAIRTRRVSDRRHHCSSPCLELGGRRRIGDSTEISFATGPVLNSISMGHLASSGFLAALLLVVLSSPATSAEPTTTKTGPHGGTVLRLGQYSAELRIWEGFVELFVCNDRGGGVPANVVQGTLRVEYRPPTGKGPGRHVAAALVPSGDRGLAFVALEGIQSASLELDLEIAGERAKGVTMWSRADDRSRLGDWQNAGLERSRDFRLKSISARR
jgi:hypothetical protein